MSMYDRDYYREHHRQQKQQRQTRARSIISNRWWSGFPPWAVWLLAIVTGTALVKVAMEARHSPPFPMTGEVHWYVGQPIGPTALLTIQAPPASKLNFVVKLDTWEGHSPIAMIPVRPGEIASVQVPLGLYRLTILKGLSWQGPGKLFMFNTDAKEVVHPIDFARVGNRLTGHSIRLETLTGNLETRPSRLGF